MTMRMTRIMLGILLAALLAGCAEDAPPPHTSYGAPSAFPGMAPSTGMDHFQGTGGFHATDEHYGPATPGPFKGF